MKSELITIFKTLPFNKSISKLKSLLQWLKDEYDITIFDVGRLRQYDQAIPEILNAVYGNMFAKMKDDFTTELKRRIRLIELNESKIMKKEELKQLIKETLQDQSVIKRYRFYSGTVLVKYEDGGIRLTNNMTQSYIMLKKDEVEELKRIL